MFVGVLAALVWGAVGYAVARRSGESFDAKNFGTTVLIGFILGLIALVLGTDVTTVESYSILQVVVIFVDKLTALLEKPATPTVAKPS